MAASPGEKSGQMGFSVCLSASATAPVTSATEASSSSVCAVGGARKNSPRAARSSTSAGRAHKLDVVS